MKMTGNETPRLLSWPQLDSGAIVQIDIEDDAKSSVKIGPVLK